MEDKTKIRLTSAEMAGLWTQYMNDTSAFCVNSYFLETVEDKEVRPIVEWTLDTAKENVSIMRNLFKKENFPLPAGFSDQDVDAKAPRLFSDVFILMYLQHMSILAMQASGSVLGLATRSDIVSFHDRILNAGLALQNKTRNLMLKQGLYNKPPYVSFPDSVDFVERQSFLTGFFGDKRPLTVIEISHLYFNIRANMVGKALITGFAQVAKHDEVKQFFVRGKQIAEKHADIFSQYLKNQDLPVSMNSDSVVTSSTTRVFSDKLMMYHITAMYASGMGNYGMAMAASPRRDIAIRYASLIPEASLYAEDGANIMIKHGWMEEPPRADDRDKLIQG